MTTHEFTELEQELIQGATEMVEALKGNNQNYIEFDVQPKDEINRIRKKLDMTQEEFCKEFDLNINTLRHWATGRRKPGKATRILFRIIDQNPDAVRQALQDK